MSTLRIVALPGSSAWRQLMPIPRDVRPELSAFCPIDDIVLLAELGGLVCPVCHGWWDQRGRCGMWLTDPAVALVPARISRVAVVLALLARVAGWVLVLLHRGRPAPLDVSETPVEVTGALLAPTCRRWRRGY